MKINKVKLRNIRSFEEEEVEFSDGSTLLSGDIGSGKTSILLAIEFAFFGLQPGQRGSALLSNGKDEGVVELEFEVGQNKIKIERSLKRGSKTISQDYAAITINGEKTESSVTELKNKVLELLNYPHEYLKKTNLLYRYTVYTPQEEMKQIVLEDPETRLNILRHIFGIDKYKRIRENLLIFTSKLREESRVLNVEIKNLEENRERLLLKKENLVSIKKQIDIKKEGLEEKIHEREKLEEDIAGIEGKIKEKQRLDRELEKNIYILSNKEEQLKREKEELINLIKKSEESESLFDPKLLEETLKQINIKKYSIENLSNKYIEYSGRISSLNIITSENLTKKERIYKIDICPTCLQDVSETHKHNIMAETEGTVSRAEKEIGDLNENLSALDKKIFTEKKELTDLEKKNNDLEVLKARSEEAKIIRKNISKLKESIKDLEKEIENLGKGIGIIKNSLADFSKFDEVFTTKQEELKKAFQLEKEIEISIATLNREVELNKEEIEELEKKITEIEKVKTRMINILELEKWLSSDFLNLISFTERNIMIKLRDEFSTLFNKWFGVLTTDAFFVHLDENFTPVISQGDFELDYSNLSGGERTAVALAYRLALNQIINSLLSKIKTQDIVILDEPTDGFSTQQLDKVRDILQELNVEQLIVVSHEQKIESFVDNIIRLTKVGGISKKE